MKIFLDTAKIEEIRKAHSLGVLDGVTTNPSLAAKAGRIIDEEYFKKIINLVRGPVSIEVIATDYKGMLSEAKRIYKINVEYAVVKIPMIRDGLKVIKKCKSLKIKTNATLIFSANQAFLAAKAGATYVSPFLGRIRDTGGDGFLVLRNIKRILQNYKSSFQSQIIAASIRSASDVQKCATIGVDIVTIPLKILEQMLQHPKTDEGLKEFLDDFKKVESKWKL